MQKQVRRPLATISFCGFSYLQQQDPRMVAWWSVVFPGFGHYLLFQYGRGTLYTISEVIFNTLSHVNEQSFLPSAVGLNWPNPSCKPDGYTGTSLFIFFVSGPVTLDHCSKTKWRSLRKSKMNRCRTILSIG
jgi:hypothetical protein